MATPTTDPDSATVFVLEGWPADLLQALSTVLDAIRSDHLPVLGPMAIDTVDRGLIFAMYAEDPQLAEEHLHAARDIAREMVKRGALRRVVGEAPAVEGRPSVLTIRGDVYRLSFLREAAEAAGLAVTQEDPALARA